MSALSNWREEFNLSEVVTGKMTDKEALGKVSEKKGISNKVTINPKLDEAVKEIGGEVISMVEQDTTAQKQRIDMKQMILDRQKLKIRRKDLSQKKKEGEGVDSTNASQQANVIAQEETVKQVNEKKRKNALQIQKVIGEGDVHSGQGEKIQKRTKAWMDKKGQKGAPGLDAMKARTAEHKAKRGVKEEVVDEGVMKFVKSIGKKKKVEKKATMDSTTKKLHNWRKDREKEERRKYVSDFDPIDESAVLDANTKISSNEKREKMTKELLRLMKHARDQKKNPHLANSYEPEGESLDERLGGKGYKSYTDLRGKKISGDWEDSDRGAGNKAKKRAGGKVEKKSPTYKAHVLNKEEVIDERTLSSYIPSDRQGEAHRANLDYTKAQLKKKEDQSTKNRGDLSKRDAGKMARERLHNRKIMSMGEDKAFDFVVAKLKKQYGDGVLTKGDKMPELSAAQKKKNDEIRAKRAKEDHRDPTEKASDGRYSDRHSNRGSD